MSSVIILASLTLICLIVSFIFDKKQTLQALIKGLKMFMNLLPPFVTVLIFVSVLLSFTSNDFLVKWLGKDSGITGILTSAVIGSISLVPGFIAYPLGRILLNSGVDYSVIAVFLTTLMMVGIITLPIEKKYFGMKVAVLRNLLSFIGAVIVGVLVGALWGTL